MYPENPNIVALASDARLDVPLPLLDLNDYDGIVAFILRHLDLRT